MVNMRHAIKEVTNTTILAVVTKYYDKPPDGLPSIPSLFHFDSPEEPKIFLVSMLEKKIEDSVPNVLKIIQKPTGFSIIFEWAHLISKVI